MKDSFRKSFGIIARYLFLLLASFFMPLFYSVLLPLTILPAYLILSVFYPVQLIANVLLVNESVIEITDACLAGSAFYLLLVLAFSTHGIRLKKRLLVFIFDSFLLLFVNILRITAFSIAFAGNFIYVLIKVFQRAVLTYPRNSGLRPYVRHAGNVVSSIAL